VILSPGLNVYRSCANEILSSLVCLQSERRTSYYNLLLLL